MASSIPPWVMPPFGSVAPAANEGGHGLWGHAPSPPNPSDDDAYVQYAETGAKITNAFRIWFAIMLGMFALYALFRFI